MAIEHVVKGNNLRDILFSEEKKKEGARCVEDSKKKEEMYKYAFHNHTHILVELCTRNWSHCFSLGNEYRKLE